MNNPRIAPAILQAAQAGDAHKAALAYQKQNFSVLPLKGKRPSLDAWAPFQSRPASEFEIHQWQRAKLFQNIAIVCGKVSGNLVVLDFDGAGAFGAFAAQYPSIAQSYTVRTGSGHGMHIYLYVDRLPATTRAMDTPIGNIELRSEGCYIVAPPSLHPVTGKPYEVERQLDILRVPDLDDVVAWIDSFKTSRQEWQPPHVLPAEDATINPLVIHAISDRLRSGNHRERGEWINCSCVHPERHTHGDAHFSFGFNVRSGYGLCYRCGTMLAKDICEALGINPADYGGLVNSVKPVVVTSKKNGGVPAPVSKPTPAPEKLTPLSEISVPDWLNQYVGWASRVGNQTPIIFHQAAGIWLLSVAIARRLYVEAPWSVRIFPNTYMMFVADTTFYRKTTAYKLAETVIRSTIPHMLMPVPGSPERFQEMLAGKLPSNYKELSYDIQGRLSKARSFAAQRGLFKDEIAGLFGAFNRRDYMWGMKDLIIELYDCPDYSDKDTQTGLTIVKDAALSILGVTTPAGMATAVSDADFQNGLLPRFLLLTPEADYAERPSLETYEPPPQLVIDGLKELHEKLPMPEQTGEDWESPDALKIEARCWDEVQAYSNRLRTLCDPNQETPLDDRLKGVYGRMHVQAVKLSMILAALDWMKTEHPAPTITLDNWKTAEAITEHWRASAHRLLDGLDRSGSARQEFRAQDRLLEAFQKAGPGGASLREVYRRLNLKAKDARQIAQDLVKAGLLVETPIDGAEGYVPTTRVGGE